MDPLLLLMREEMVGRLTSAAASMGATAEMLTKVREVAGDVRGTEAMRAAIEDLTRTRDHLLAQAGAISACAPAR
ncbi:hypothetical protein AB0M02_46280 [Actinoplanes sp. NPDC051861]|uniref:hypothetical protein n=1 Tax=Actinoplanes sp. NPDC051861 TaxID=3155170 RepID=UPI00342108DE